MCLYVCRNKYELLLFAPRDAQGVALPPWQVGVGLEKKKHKKLKKDQSIEHSIPTETNTIVATKPAFNIPDRSVWENNTFLRSFYSKF